MSSKWTHAMCTACWNARNPERRAATVINVSAEPCCYCGQETAAGIYVRGEPSELPCKGEHPEAVPLADRTDE